MPRPDWWVVAEFILRFPEDLREQAAIAQVLPDIDIDIDIDIDLTALESSLTKTRALKKNRWRRRCSRAAFGWWHPPHEAAAGRQQPFDWGLSAACPQNPSESILFYPKKDKLSSTG